MRLLRSFEVRGAGRRKLLHGGRLQVRRGRCLQLLHRRGRRLNTASPSLPDPDRHLVDRHLGLSRGTSRTYRLGILGYVRLLNLGSAAELGYAP